jgi:hypothetical protein
VWCGPSTSGARKSPRDVDPFAARFPLPTGAKVVPGQEELDGAHDTFVWMWVIVALLVVSAIHSLYAYFARPSAGLASAVNWGQQRVDDGHRREHEAGIDAGAGATGPNGAAASNEAQQQQQQQPPHACVGREPPDRLRCVKENARAALFPRETTTPFAPAVTPSSLPLCPPSPPLPPPPPFPRTELGITPDDDDPFGMRAEDELEIEERELLERAAGAPVKPRRIPIALSQIVFGFLTASVAVAMATAPSDWILPMDAGEGKPLAYLLATASSRRATAFLIRFMAVVKLSTCFYPVLVVAEDGRLRTVMNARTYTIAGLIPVCWLAGWFSADSTYYGVGWATGLFFIVDELVGLFLTYLELAWSVRTWLTRQKRD